MKRIAVLGTAIGALACASPAVHNLDPAPGMNGGAGGGPGTGGATGFALPPGTTPPAAAAPDGGVTPGDPVCAATRAQAVPVPVDLYIMEDQSGSMGDPPTATSVERKWDAVRKALTAFVSLPAARGMSVGLGFFPRLPGPVPPECNGCDSAECLASCGCVSITCRGDFCLCAQFSTSSCFASDYFQPAVAIAELPAASRPIIDALESVRPAGGTPSHAALEGAIRYARSWVASKGRKVAIALATDGEPTNCGEKNSVGSISALARRAAAEGMPTFVIGVGQELDNLDAIAAAGGTGRAYLVEGYDVEEKFLGALQAIQGAAARLSCSYGIPAPPAGQALDPLKVNVELTSGAPAQTTIVGQVAARDRCDDRGGWYYDDPAAPAQIHLCDATCKAVNGAVGSQVAVTFGCRTSSID